MIACPATAAGRFSPVGPPHHGAASASCAANRRREREARSGHRVESPWASICAHGSRTREAGLGAGEQAADVLAVQRDDIRRHGSGNVGATNVWRVYGWSLGLPVAVLDVLKGLVPATLGLRLGGDWVGVRAGAAGMLGHARPVFLGFSKGGKMVATAGGVALALAPFAALGCAAIWLVTFALTRYASLSSMVAAVALPLLSIAFGASWPVVAFTALAALGVVALHRQNVRRLLAGTEPRFARRRTVRAD